MGATLHRGARASHYRGLSCCGAQAPDVQAQQLWLTGLVALRHVGSSQTRARTRVLCIGRQILNHCATREALLIYFCTRESVHFISRVTIATLGKTPSLFSQTTVIPPSLALLFAQPPPVRPLHSIQREHLEIKTRSCYFSASVASCCSQDKILGLLPNSPQDPVGLAIFMQLSLI